MKIPTHKPPIPPGTTETRTSGGIGCTLPEEAVPDGVAVGGGAERAAGHGEAGDVAGDEGAGAVGQHVSVEVGERPRWRRGARPSPPPYRETLGRSAAAAAAREGESRREEVVIS